MLCGLWNWKMNWKQFPEEDWKILKKLKVQLLQDFCDNILDQLEPIIKNRKNGSHRAYLDLWKILNKKNNELANMFDDLKRSTAFFKLAAWRDIGFLSEDNFNKFRNKKLCKDY